MKNGAGTACKRAWAGAASFLFLLSGALAAAPAVRNECAAPPPGTIFCEDFEGASPKSRFDDYDGNPDSENLIVVDSGSANDPANKAIRLRVSAGQKGGSDLLKILPRGYDTLYARWYFMYEPGFNFNAANHGGGLTAGERDYIGQSGNRPSGADFASLTVQYQPGTAWPFAYSYYRGMDQDCSNPAGSCWGDSLPCVYDAGSAHCTKPRYRTAIRLPTLKAGRWYCVEEMVDMGTPNATGVNPNGRFALWLDGQLLGEYGDLWLRTTPKLKIQNLWLSLFHHDATHSTAGELLDNVVVSTQRIGCATPATTDPLIPPSNLRVISTSP